jgi:hypothetical protein
MTDSPEKFMARATKILACEHKWFWISEFDGFWECSRCKAERDEEGRVFLGLYDRVSGGEQVKTLNKRLQRRLLASGK